MAQWVIYPHSPRTFQVWHRQNSLGRYHNRAESFYATDVDLLLYGFVSNGTLNPVAAIEAKRGDSKLNLDGAKRQISAASERHQVRSQGLALEIPLFIVVYVESDQTINLDGEEVPDIVRLYLADARYPEDTVEKTPKQYAEWEHDLRQRHLP